MADAKISELTAQTAATIAIDDEFVMVDTGSTATERLTVAELMLYLTANLKLDIDTVDATNAAYALSNTLQVVVIDDDGDNTDIAITLAAAIPTGAIAVFHAADGGSTGHTVTLGGSQTWDGTNNIATFNAADDRVAVIAISATRVIIIYNNSVTFST